MNGIHPDLLKQLKEYYKPGTRIRLVHMSDPYETVPQGTIGIVTGVDDLGTVHTVWNNGSTLGVAFGVDYAEKIEEGDHE